MEVKAQFRNRIGVLALFALVGAAGAAVLYYGMYFVLALVNYFDSFYKHETFYQLYPTAASYLATFFSTGTLKHLPGYEIEINLGIPLLFGCGMVCAWVFCWRCCCAEMNYPWAGIRSVVRPFSASPLRGRFGICSR